MASDLSNFEIRFAPRESMDLDPIERVAAADISILADGVCLTELEDRAAQTVRPTVRASAYRLAYWLAANWWRIRWEPEATDLDWRLSHLLPAIGGGYIWPALGIMSDGEHIELRMRSSRPVNATAPTENIRYLIDRDLRIPVDAFVAGVDLFIDAVIGRLRTTGYTETELETLWAEVQAERTTAEVAHWRKLEALAGLDPDADDSAFLEALQTQQMQVGPAAIEELLAAFKRDAPAMLSDLQDSGRCSATTLTIADIAPLSKRIRVKATKWMSIKQPGDAPPEPWQRAYEAADMARAHWQLPVGRLSNDLLGQLVGMAEDRIAQPNDADARLGPVSAGYRDGEDSGRLSVWLSARVPTSRRFALARLLGDHLLSTDQERLLPATAARTARQKFQLAFAQQFLCPIEDLKAFLASNQPDDEQIEDAASEFDVSPLLIKTTLVNHGLIGREALLRSA